MQRPALLLNGNLAVSRHRRLRNSLARAFTLIEVLVAMTVTMILMGIVVTIFGAIGDNVSKSNSSMEMNDQLRAVKQRLQLDLSGVTVQMLPPRRDENGEGYFEIIEGPVGRLPPNTSFVIDETYDTTQSATSAWNSASLGPDTTVGDNDDILMFTTRSKGEMFLGRGVAGIYNGSNNPPAVYSTVSLQSQVAEVAWFMRGTTLYRRQLLVRPDLPSLPNATNPSAQYVVPQPTMSGQNPIGFPNNFTSPQWQYPTNFYSVCDVSARATGQGFDLSPSPPPFYVVANSLEDLTKRENRFAHYPLVAGTSPYGWPHDVRGWGKAFTTSPFGAVPGCGIFRGFQPSPFPPLTYPLSGTVATSGRLGLPTLRECSSLYFPVPGAFELQNTGQIFLGNSSGQGLSAGSPLKEPFDAWTNPNPAWTVQLGATVKSGTADPLTGTLLNIFPDNPAPSPFGSRYGEDVIMTHVLSFDVRVWDPSAAVVGATDSSGTTSIYAPGDPAYLLTVLHWVQGNGPPGMSYAIAARGAYVDLYYSAGFPYFLAVTSNSLSAAQTTALNAVTASTFSGPGNWNSGLGSYAYPSTTTDPYQATVYDTGSWHYENDGIDQGPMINPNGVTVSIADEGTNGLDDNNDGVVDDLGEFEAPPPYFDTVQGGYPLRGVQIKIRCFDVDSQEIREVTIVQEFVPE